MPLGNAIHVQPHRRGHWVVRDEHDPKFASEHGTATEAEFAARSRALASGVPVVLVHDRYERVRHSPVTPRRPRQIL
jgi:hypothetical protein